MRKPDFEPNFDCFMLDRKAKLTDIIITSTVNAAGFIVSDKLKNIFDNFKLPSHTYYPAVLIHKKERITNYYWLHFTEDNTKNIDFANSEFIKRDPLFAKDFEKLSINNEDELKIERKKSSLKHIFPVRLKIFNQCDFMLFDSLWNKYYISNKLNEELKKGSTGISTNLATFIYY